MFAFKLIKLFHLPGLRMTYAKNYTGSLVGYTKWHKTTPNTLLSHQYHTPHRLSAHTTHTIKTSIKIFYKYISFTLDSLYFHRIHLIKPPQRYLHFTHTALHQNATHSLFPKTIASFPPLSPLILPFSLNNRNLPLNNIFSLCVTRHHHFLHPTLTKSNPHYAPSLNHSKTHSKYNSTPSTPQKLPMNTQINYLGSPNYSMKRRSQGRQSNSNKRNNRPTPPRSQSFFTSFKCFAPTSDILTQLNIPDKMQKAYITKNQNRALPQALYDTCMSRISGTDTQKTTANERIHYTFCLAGNDVLETFNQTERYLILANTHDSEILDPISYAQKIVDLVTTNPYLVTMAFAPPNAHDAATTNGTSILQPCPLCHMHCKSFPRAFEPTLKHATNHNHFLALHNKKRFLSPYGRLYDQNAFEKHTMDPSIDTSVFKLTDDEHILLNLLHKFILTLTQTLEPYITTLTDNLNTPLTKEEADKYYELTGITATIPPLDTQTTDQEDDSNSNDTPTKPSAKPLVGPDAQD
jgi:hypothetical protein